MLRTHSHCDHLDLATLARLKAAHDPLEITPLGKAALRAAILPVGADEPRLFMQGPHRALDALGRALDAHSVPRDRFRALNPVEARAIPA